MGVVYRAQDPRLGREVALKVLPEALALDPEAKGRLLREARAAATLDHPNVCTVYEVGETPEGRPFIALACYDGETLDERIHRGPLEVAEAVRIARGIAAGVATAHAHGIVHRDLKPANVFVAADGTPKVLDFGVASVAEDGRAGPGEAVGTLTYGAPEQDAGAADARSDVWALGLVLYEMLTGENPFVAPYAAAVRYNVLHEHPPPPSARADVPSALDAVVLRALAKDPADRYPDAAAFGDALAAATAPAPLTARLRPRFAGLAVLLAALAGIGVWTVQPGGPFAREAVHLAVLAFEPESDAPDDRAFAEGLAETLASGVAEAAPPETGLWVVPMTEVRGLAVTTARAAGTVLGANRVLSGRLVRDGGGLVLTLDLASTGDRPRTLDSKALQISEGAPVRGQALQAVVEMLGLAPVAGPAAERGTADPEAQRFFLAGVGYLERDREAEDLDRAIDLFEQAIAEDPAFAAAHARLGEAFLASYEATRDSVWVGRTRDAAARAEALDDRDPRVHITLSALAETTGETTLAMHHARRALALDPTGVRAHLALAAAQEAAADLEGTEATLRGIVDRQPDVWTGPFALGAFYLRQLRTDEAEAAFARVVALAPGNYQGHSGVGAARLLAGDTRGARAAYEEVLALRPDLRSVYVNLGTLLLADGDARGAVRRYRQALALDSSSHVAWNNLASAYAALDDSLRIVRALRGALRQVERDLAVNPNDPVALAAAATYREGTGDAAGARDAARRAVALAPADPQVQYEAARVFALLEDNAAALDALAAAAAAGHPLTEADQERAFADLLRHPRFPTPPR